jgi:hypothetical protein
MIHVLLGPADFDDRIPHRESCVHWQDDLSVGPVPATKTLEELSQIREAFWNMRRPFSGLFELGGKRAAAEQSGTKEPTRPAFTLAKRDEQIRRLGDFREAVVWCGPNRREMFMLFAVLGFLDPVALRETTMMIAPCPQWGALSYNAEQLARVFDARSSISPEFAALAREMWMQYAAPDPMPFGETAVRLRDQHASLARVLSWVLEDYPSLDSGLSQIEEIVLRNSGDGNLVSKIVATTIGESDDTIGDMPLSERIWHFLSDGTPLLEPAAPGVSPADLDSWQDFRRLAVRPTALGKRLLKGEGDYVQINGLDRWIGGVHLRGNTVPWRFDRNTRRLVTA